MGNSSPSLISLRIVCVQILKDFVILIALVALCAVIPAVLLYPPGVWALNHTRYTEDTIVHAYLIGIGVLWLPMGLVLDFLYRRFVKVRQNLPSLQR
jgi:hypothetical protein